MQKLQRETRSRIADNAKLIEREKYPNISLYNKRNLYDVIIKNIYLCKYTSER